MCANVDEDNHLAMILKNGSVVAADVDASAAWVRSIDRMIIEYPVKSVMHK